MLFASFAALPSWAQQSEIQTVDEPLDHDAIRSQLQRYGKAIDDRDWGRVFEFLDEDVQYRDDSLQLRADGRDALIAQIRGALSESDLKLVASFSDIKIESDTTAVVKGTNSLGTQDDPGELFSFTVTMNRDSGTRDSGNWKIKSIVEQSMNPAPDASSAESPLWELDWMVGNWQDRSDSRLTSSIRYLPGKQFLVRTFNQGGDNAGFQVIGYDSVMASIRSWSYFMDGSFGNATWSLEQDRWLIKSAQTLADGRMASGTYVITPDDSNTVTVKLVGHEIAGQPVPLAPEMIVVRVTEADTSADQAESNE